MVINIKEKRIVIIGGGPGGLSLARMLQLKGCENVMVVERDIDRSVRIPGGTLDLHPYSGLHFIKEAKLENEFKQLSRPEGASFTLTDRNGNFKLRCPHLKISALKPEIDRGVLRDLLIDSLTPETVQWDHHFKTLKKLEDDTIEIEFKNGKKIIADVVIGADGANSKIRPFVNEKLKPIYSGVTIVECEVNDPNETCSEAVTLVDHGTYSAIDNGKAFMLQMKGDGTLVVYCAMKKPEFWHKEIDFNNREQVLNILKNEEIPDWNPIYHKVLDNISSKFIPRPLYTIPCTKEHLSNSDNQPWTTEAPITLIGDAAHVIVPFQGAGVNMALMDAVELSESLVNPPKSDSSIIERLNQYELKMQKRMSKEAIESMEAMELFTYDTNAPDQAISFFFGKFKFLVPILPLFINFINYFTDLFGFTK
ncbi:hypothetical protein DICPUDRAFT_77541 [Dictyostelium purpureum]|uniref:FAD-binding domain-containing protein n=1 Tax=Dictyostelium purpureum TaxID=5786 RepID=F0ZGX4_DICPU|nr:uncharacterized protein DICPUDRAFT_77541 [Dictyostelium purpureum]EGC36810.1 hypothetical protein DICPUDRAFT_77541 [Dictyostelium purpureum]|eukprot:XP_003286681.1 hypothetical protein DICPUDRAFT_77541 [Dictyostelium purpureum]